MPLAIWIQTFYRQRYFCFRLFYFLRFFPAEFITFRLYQNLREKNCLVSSKKPTYHKFLFTLFFLLFKDQNTIDTLRFFSSRMREARAQCHSLLETE